MSDNTVLVDDSVNHKNIDVCDEISLSEKLLGQVFEMDDIEAELTYSCSPMCFV